MSRKPFLAILARVLMLVACLPLLQPTGYCICKAGPRTRATSDRQVATMGDPAAVKTLCCCRNPDCSGDHRHTSTIPTGENPTKPAPDDDSHMPGCPASPGVDRYKFAEPTPSLVHPQPVVSFVAFVPVGVEPAPFPLPVNPVNWPSSPPLYLSYCSLVI